MKIKTTKLIVAWTLLFPFIFLAALGHGVEKLGDGIDILLDKLMEWGGPSAN